MTIGERIKARREALGMTQDDLAKKMGYTSRSTINKVEKNYHDIAQSNILKYAEVLDTTPAYLMGWEDNSYIIETFNAYPKNIQQRLIEYGNFLMSVGESDAH